MADQVRVRVLYFAAARERAGCGEEQLDLPRRTDVAGINAALASRHPALHGLLGYSRIAVGECFCQGAVELRDGDEVAVIPPVSGG